MHTLLLLGLLFGGLSDSAYESEGCRILLDVGVFPSDDEGRAEAACTRARTRFSELFGDPAPEVIIVLQDEPAYRLGVREGAAVVFWPTSEVMRPALDDEAAIEEHLDDQWEEVLPHEIAHLLTAAHFFPDSPSDPAGGYGTPFPDWLDEALAIWAEPRESRTRRVEQVLELPEEYLDLGAILRMEHPATGRSASFIARDGTAETAEFRLWAFYPQSIAVLTFIYENGGEEAVRELTERLQADPRDDAALLGLPGLPDEMEELERGWEEWRRGLAKGADSH